MEDHQLQFICKFCYKKFPCGKSLGGHIRSHLTSKSNSSESDEKEVGFGVEAALKDAKTGEFSNGQSSYVLRENPARTWKTAADSNSKSNSRICKQCGKSFQSHKALCGHMACHSEKEKNPKADDDDYDDEEEEDDDDSWASERGGGGSGKRVFFDAHSDTESEDLAMRTASIRAPCKKTKKIDGPNYSSVTEIDDERADLAKSLMKLSRDRSGYADVSSSIEAAQKRESAGIEDGRSIGKAEDFDGGGDTASSDTSGYYLEEYGNNGEAEVSSDRDARMYNSAAVAAYFAGFEAKKKRAPLTRNENNNQETTCDDSPAKRSKYECFNCKKAFKSYQALGGHRPCHKRMGSNSNSASEPKLEAGENVPEDSKEAADTNANRNKMASGGNKGGGAIERKDKGKKIGGGGNKGHVCPFCDRVFKNGQALGGHKRSHFLGGGNNNEGSGSGSHVRELAGKPRLLDLNLPAPKEEGGDADDDDDGDEDGDEDGGGDDEEEEEEEEEDEVEEEGDDDQSVTWR